VLIFARRAHVIIPVILSILFFIFVSPLLMRLATDVVGTGIWSVDRILYHFCGFSSYIQHVMYNDWSWKPTHSVLANVLIGIPHVIVKIVTWVSDIVIVFLMGGVPGAIICFFANAGIWIGHGCSTHSVHFLSYKSFFMGGAYVGGVIENILAVFLIMYVITLLILKPFGRWIVVPSVSSIWWFSHKRRRNRMKQTDKEDMERYIPEKFDKRKIEVGLQKYRSDSNLLGIYISRLTDEFRTDQEIKFIQKQMDLLNIKTSFMEAIIGLEKTQHRGDLLDKEKNLDEKRMDSEIKKMDRDIDLADLEKEARAEELKTRIARAKLERENLGKAKEEKEINIEDIVNDIKNQSISIVKAKEEIMNTYPPDVAEQIIDELERRMVEQDIQKKGRYQSGS
jgi:hypothetical protein